MRALAKMGNIIQVANCNKRDEYWKKREMVRTWALNSNRKRQHHSLVGYANANRLRDKANKQDIGIKNRQEKNCLFIYMTIHTEKNTSVKVTEKLSKYRPWNRNWQNVGVKASAILEVIEALGLIEKGLDQYIQQIPILVTSQYMNYRRSNFLEQLTS